MKTKITPHKISDFDLTGIWPHHSFFGCKTCITQGELLTNCAGYPICSKCGKRHDIITVTEQDFTEWLAKPTFERVLNGMDKKRIDYNKLVRRAEKEISYSARRAIEMYIPAWEKEPSWNLFRYCAKKLALCESEIERCQWLMREFYMVEESEIGNCEPLKYNQQNEGVK